MWWVDLGLLSYREGFFEIHQRVITAKREKRLQEDLLFFQQYHPVITYGRGGGREHLLLPLKEYAARGIDIYPVNRGGNVTYHGPGQLVISPIIDMDNLGLGLHRYIAGLEEVIIRVLAQYGITATGGSQYTGVWVGNAKIAALGIGFRRRIVFHGVALNVAPDLEPFQLIVPCGLEGRAVTSMAQLLGREPDIIKVRQSYCRHFTQVFGVNLVEMQPAELKSLWGGEDNGS